jgi:hypothetical protein
VHYKILKKEISKKEEGRKMIDNKRIYKLDRIVISQDDVDNLFEWRDNNKDLVRNFKPVMKEGVIIVKDDDSDIGHLQSFHEFDDYYLLRVWVWNDDRILHEIKWEKETKAGYVTHSMLEEFGKSRDFNESCISLFASLMAFIEHQNDNKDCVVVEEKAIINNKKKKKKNNGKNAKNNRTVKIKLQQYTVKVNSGVANSEKRKYEITMSKWNVRGHWRTLKDGRKVWVRPYTKGKGNDVVPKNYQVEINGLN